MFKKLRWKFMWVSTLILLVVIITVMGTVYRIASATVTSQTRFLMEEILENGGSLSAPKKFNPQERPLLALNEESIYEIRYYITQIDEQGTRITHINIAIPEDKAIDIAESIYEKNKSFGSITISRNRKMNYLRQTQEDGSTLIIFLDTTSRYNLIRLVMAYMSCLWLIVLAVYVVVMGRYSGNLVRPFMENDERQKRFITNASHELKTPLAVILANTEMTEAVAGKTRWTESTKRQVGKLETLIGDLVVLSRLDEMHEITLTEMDLSALTSETIEPFRSVIESSGKKLNTGIVPGLHRKAEEQSFQQLVSILMDNAVKYCDEGGEIEVTLSGKEPGKAARLTVSNTYAAGKDLDYSRFFERFYREDTSHNSAKTGFGIGLSMGKELAERTGGKLKVHYEDSMISFVFEL